MQEALVEKVLCAAEQIPPGRVASYGDLAGLVGTGPRQVGAILSRYGAGVCWWRVTNASGDLVAHLRGRAAEQWAAEQIAWKPSGTGCAIGRYRCDLAALADAYDRAVAALERTN